jgi:hypothetical protein
LYDVFSLSALSICGPSTSTVHQRPQQQENSLPIAGQETQGVQQGLMKYYLNKIDASFHQCLPNMVQRLFADVIHDAIWFMNFIEQNHP